MKFELPFSDATIAELVGKTIVLSENNRNESLFRAFRTVKVKSGGDIDGGRFEVVDGVLRLVEEQGLFCEFTGIESRNAAVFAVGVAAQTVSRHGFDRITMHEQKLLAPDSLGICISSHTNYADSTLPLLLGSLRKAKFEMSKVVVVVGGFGGDKVETVEGVKVVYREPNMNSFGGLVEATGDTPYWLLLPDTCEAERSLVESLAKIDIGLCPDVVRLRRDEWMGLYSKTFLDKIRSSLSSSPEEAEKAIQHLSSIVTVLPGQIVGLGVRDVYGNGHRRAVEKIESAGIRKYRGLAGRRTP